MAISAYLAITTERHADGIVVRLLGELDVADADDLRRAMKGILERPAQTLVVDASGLGFADCGGLSVLVSVQRHLAGQGRELIITDPQPLVRRLLALTGLDAFLHIRDSQNLHEDPGPRTPA